MCKNKRCRCNNPKYSFICTNSEPVPGCEDRNLAVSNTNEPDGSDQIVTISTGVNQISAYKNHLEFVNSPEPLSGIKKHVVIRIAQSFIDGITGLISNFVGQNVGLTGAAEVYKGPRTVGQNVIQDFRKIAGSPSIDVEQIGDNIVPSVDEEWLQEQFPSVDYPVTDGVSVGTGQAIYKGLTGKKIRLASLKTSNLAMVVDEDGTINIDIPSSGSSSNNSYFVDETYEPTPTSQPDGTRARPFTSLTDAVMARLGGIDTPARRLNPPGSKNTITLLSNVSDSINPTINNTWFRLEGVRYLYTGNRSHIFDLKELYDLTKIPNGPMGVDIYFVIQGTGTITRSTGFGHCRNINDDTYPNASGSDPMSSLKLDPEGSGLQFIENENYTPYLPLTNSDGTPIMVGADTAYGANIAPSIPMFSMIGAAKQYWGTEISGTSVKILTMSQVGIRLENGGSIYDRSTIDLIVDQSSTYIGYETRDASNTQVMYLPYATRNLVEIINGSVLQTDFFSFFPDSPPYTRVNSIFKMVGVTNGDKNNVLTIVNELKPMSNKGATNFIEYSGLNNIAQLNKVNAVGYYTNFVKGDGVNTLNLTFQESVINKVVNRFVDAGNTSNFSTGGTISTIKGTTYITGLQTFTNNATAKAALGVNALYTIITTGDDTSVHITR